MLAFLRPALTLISLVVFTMMARGHFSMLLPSAASAKRGEEVTLTYHWGHPFEHQLFNAPAPEELFVFAPDGHKTSLLDQLEKFTAPAGEGKRVTAYRLRFTPTERGDYRFVLSTPPIWMEEDQEFLQDRVTVVLHVQAQKGWEADADLPLEVLPLTRPYGLQPGMAFQAQARADGKPLAGVLAEIEHYHPAPPERLPPDEHITRTARTDAGGGFIATLTEPGWWCLSVARAGGKRAHAGKKYPLRRRAILWVFVDGAIQLRSGKDAP